MKQILNFFAVAAILILAVSCQKMKRPELGNYPVDANPPGGPLKFYAAFDGTTTNPLMNAVDSIKATFPSDNPFTVTDGIKGKGITGVNQKFLKYPSFNAWAGSNSFSISVWFKQNGQTKNNAGGNGPNHILSLKAQDNYHWSNAVLLLFLEGDNAGCAVKCMTVSPSAAANPNSSPADNWFTWEGGQTIAGLCNNQWHHMVLTYSETSSNMTLYIDGVANPNVKSWSGHGAIRFATTKITEFRVGAGPSNSFSSDDWLACSMKGSMDQLRLYSTVLTVAEIQALYAAKL